MRMDKYTLMTKAWPSPLNEFSDISSRPREHALHPYHLRVNTEQAKDPRTPLLARYR